MPKLKLKQNNEIGVGIKSVKQKDVGSSKKDQEQSKLLKFFRTSQEDDAADKKEPKKTQIIQETTSRFFQNTMTHNVGEMDESVSEFKPESKAKRVQSKHANDTKMSSKGKKPSVKLKKASKSKGSGGKQYLQEYTREFDQVCAIGGVDVDPEHLQLAIALSRSLTDFQGSSEVNEEAQTQVANREPSTSLEYETEDDKVKRIRKTLDQYGFKVPVGPILLRPKAKVRRKRADKITNTPLLTKSLEEKKQITSDIVSQILFECITKNCDILENCDRTEINSSVLREIWSDNSPIFSKASLQYIDMKEYDVFYVKNLVTPSDSTAGCLLKDWSKIPGRDPSPERKVETLDFRETILYTHNFDDLLSSTISYIRNKMSEINVVSPTKSPSSNKTQTFQGHDSGICTTIVNNSISNKSSEISNSPVVINNDSRSCSPDIFEDFYAEDDISDQHIPEKDEGLKTVCVEIVDSSDDELPNVYMSQPRKYETVVSPVKCVVSPLDEICKNVDSAEKNNKDEINNSIDLTQDNYFPNESVENCQSFESKAKEIDTMHSDSRKSENEAYLENTTIINDSKICEDINIDSVINDSIDLTQNSYVPVKSTKITSSFDVNNEDTNKYSKLNSPDCIKNKISNTIDIMNNLSTSKDIKADEEVVFENKKTRKMSPFKKTPKKDIIDEDFEILETIEEPDIKNNISALQSTQNESFVNNTFKIKMNKLNKISLGSINDSIQFDLLLKDFRSNQVNGNGDCYKDKESTSEDSVEITEEDNVCSEEHNSKDISRMRNFSQIYESDNGIVHFESYCEENEPLDVSSISESSLKEINDLMKDKIKNVNDISLSSPECSKNNSINNRVSIENIFENSVNYSVQPVNFDNDNEDIDLTQLSNDSSDSYSCMQNKTSNKFQNNDVIFDASEKNSDDVIMNVTCGERRSEKILRDSSFSDNSALDDVFVISDEEFNYSIGTSHTKKQRDVHSPKRRNSKKVNCNEISESESSDTTDSAAKMVSFAASEIVKLCNKNKSNHDLSITEEECKPCRISNKFDLYGSSIFDQIPSCNSTLAKDLNNETFNDITGKRASLKSNDMESFSARYYPQFNDLTQPETVLNCSEDLPNVYMKNHQKEIAEVQKAKDKDLIENFTLLKDSDAKETPETCRYTIKTDMVTPAQNYCAMDTPRIHKELSKFGLKPLKRKRAVQMLEHIYKQTHPIVNTNDLERKLKRRRIHYNSTILENAANSSGLNKPLVVADTQKENVLPDKIESREFIVSPRVASAGSPLKSSEQIENMLKDPAIVQDDNIYKPDCIKIDIKHIECDPCDWVFQNKEKKKVLGCRVPLHIAFHNYLSVRSKLKDAILRYDPVNIDVIHKGLAADGYKYNSKDLFHFMDKKCITIKTTDKTGGARQHQKER